MNLKQTVTMMVNRLRRIDHMFPEYFTADTKHNHYRDFGYPEYLDFAALHKMFRRNGLAAGAVEQTILETWQDFPAIRQNDDPEETETEKKIRQHFEKMRLWQKFSECDRRSMVGRYAGIILRIRDNQQFNQPVTGVRMGLDALVDVIPAWEGQLTVAEWDDDINSEAYGEPKMFQFNEANVIEPGSNTRQNRAFDVHPDRVIIWSRDGTVHCASKLEAGYNDLLSIEKINGAGGEGFWKNATGRPVLETDKDVKIDDIARGMGVGVDEIADKMDDQVEDFNKGFDAMLMLQGMKAKTLSAELNSPEHFFAGPLQVFCASWPIPAKKLVGSQTGERASTEDNDTWKKTNNARRENIVKPTIMTFIERLVEFGILGSEDWLIAWTDLTETSMVERIERAKSMAEINAKQPDEPVFTVDEIRETVDMAPNDELGEDDENDDETDIDDPTTEDPDDDE